MEKFLVTGSAGFIGFHVAKRLLRQGKQVLGLDNLSAYYDVNLKHARLAQLAGHRGFRFVQADLAERAPVERLFAEESLDCVIHLAAQAGVRFSLTDPHAYIQSNVVGFTHVLEGCRHAQVKHLVFASSSSVYGANQLLPFSTHHNVDHPLSLYAATKKADELLAHVYAHLYGLPCTGLRFFTVYGPWGRPDMVLFIFTKAILEDRPIEVYNFGKMRRDFTYIDDIVESVVRLVDKVPSANRAWNGNEPDPASSSAPYRIFNVGAHSPVEIGEMIGLLEEKLGRRARRQFLPLPAGDVQATAADVADLEKEIGFKPRTALREGISRFVDWYLEYHQMPAVERIPAEVATHARTEAGFVPALRGMATKPL
jgi:UDP-glucuronate 4-epimerase